MVQSDPSSPVEKTGSVVFEPVDIFKLGVSKPKRPAMTAYNMPKLPQKLREHKAEDYPGLLPATGTSQIATGKATQHMQMPNAMQPQRARNLALTDPSKDHLGKQVNRVDDYLIAFFNGRIGVKFPTTLGNDENGHPLFSLCDMCDKKAGDPVRQHDTEQHGKFWVYYYDTGEQARFSRHMDINLVKKGDRPARYCPEKILPNQFWSDDATRGPETPPRKKGKRPDRFHLYSSDLTRFDTETVNAMIPLLDRGSDASRTIPNEAKDPEGYSATRTEIARLWKAIKDLELGSKKAGNQQAKENKRESSP